MKAAAKISVTRKSIALFGASLVTLLLSAISGCGGGGGGSDSSTPEPAAAVPAAAATVALTVPVTLDTDAGPPPFVFNERCVPYEITDEFMLANGVDPTMILTTFGADEPPDDGTGNGEDGPGGGGTPAPWTWDLDAEGNPVPCDEFHTHKRRTRYEACHFYDGTPCYFTTNGQLDQDSFTNDAAGRRAFDIAEHFVIYEVVQSLVDSPDGYSPATIFTDPFAGGFAVGTQTKLMNGSGTYFEDDPLGTWKMGLIQFTDKAFACLSDGSSKDCQYLIALRAENGSNSQNIGMPLIVSGDDLFGLTDRALVTLRYRLGADGVPGGPQGPRYLLCPVHEDPSIATSLNPGQDIIQAFPTHLEFQPPVIPMTILADGPRGSIRTDYEYLFGHTPPEAPKEENLYTQFDCLQRTGNWCP